jgi:hypothetical protein
MAGGAQIQRHVEGRVQVLDPWAGAGCGHLLRRAVQEPRREFQVAVRGRYLGREAYDRRQLFSEGEHLGCAGERGLVGVGGLDGQSDLVIERDGHQHGPAQEPFLRLP